MPTRERDIGRELSLHGIERVARKAYVTWIRVGILSAAVGYSVVVVLNPVWGESVPWQELAVAVLSWGGFVLVQRGRARTAAVLVLCAVWAEAHLSIFRNASLGDYVGQPVLPTLVAAVGLLLGSRAAYAIAGTTVFSAPLAEVLGRRLLLEPGTWGLPEDWFVALVLGLSVMAMAILVSSGLGTFGQVLESALRSERRSAQLGEILEQAASEIYIVGTEPLEFLMVSRGACDSLGYAPEELRGLSPDAISPLLTDDLLAALGAGVENRPGGLVETRHSVHRRKDGSAYPVEAFLQVGELAGRVILIVFAIDISDRVEAEEQSAVLRERLQQAQKLDAVGLLAGGVAHDFNNLLTVIGGSAELIELTAEPSVAALASEISKAKERGSMLTKKLLAFARQEVVQSSVLSVSEVVEEARSLVETLLGGSIEMRVETARDGAVVADPGQIEQVLLNLAANARDAMPDGGVVTIEVDAGDSRPGYARIAVRDTGHGMDAETMRRAFEPFFTTKPRGKGTGLGLSTVHGIAGQNGGSVEIESSPEGGTVVSVFWPLHHDQTASAGGEAESDRSDPAGGGGSILVVEDNDATRRVVCLHLESAGYRVVAVDQGEAALRELEGEGGFDLLLTDVVMPGMSGIDLAEQVSARWPHLPVLLMSGFMDGQGGDGGTLEAGRTLIHKPFKGSELVSLVRDMVGGATGH